MASTATERSLAVALLAALAGGAAGAGMTLFLGSGGEAAAAQPVVQEHVPEDTSDLEARLAALEQRVAGLDLAPVAATPAPRVEDDRTNARLEALERSIEDLARSEAQPVDPEVAAEALRVERLERRRKAEAAARETILDPSASEADKIDAWRTLRSSDEWGAGIVEEMIRIGESSPDEETRADVWRQADARDRSDLLVQPLLNALAHDTSAAVRSEAAETLGNYRSVPGVLDALRHAAEFDASEEVREEASDAMRD
ncbi:MAG: HEAT repeat domain-containing protein [Planctomycetota bacterium]